MKRGRAGGRTAGAARAVTLDGRLRKLLTTFFIPVIALVLIVLVVFVMYVSKYTSILHNVTTASEFNQDFKDSIDQKMYYYVVGSHYSEGLPIEEVRAAQELARGLLETTTQRDSWKAIDGVLSLCQNLEEKIYLIERTDNYDERLTQLENNIYVLTDLIQEYMYNYLYYEASLLASLQEEMMGRLYLELALIILAMAMLVMLFVRRSLRFGRSITQPISDLCVRVKSIGDGDLTVRTPIQAQEYEIQTLSDGFENMVGRLNQLIEQNRQEQVSLRSAELALLQAQINPHFLFNSLNAGAQLAMMEDAEKTSIFIERMADFFRYNVRKIEETATLAEELEAVDNYVYILNVRFAGDIHYETNIAPGFDEVRLPSMILQPIVENAVNHGIRNIEREGHIRLTVAPVDGNLRISVRDNGQGMSRERIEEVLSGRARTSGSDSTGIGLDNVMNRLELFFGEKDLFEIESAGRDQGVEVRLTVPLHGSGNAESPGKV